MDPTSPSLDAPWFDNRPLRSAHCAHCRGSGWIDRAYALAPARSQVHRHSIALDAPDNAILAFVNGAFDIFTACQEAADIAQKSQRPVTFQFDNYTVNNYTVTLWPGDDPDSKARQWWQLSYNETPEQTRARR